MSKRQKDVWRSARAALVGIGLLCGSTAFAQITGSTLTGNVVDAATKAPVADVVVTATSPAMQGEQVVVTDSTGLYRVPQLPPGTYTLRFEKESYRPFARAGIEVAADRTLRVWLTRALTPRASVAVGAQVRLVQEKGDQGTRVSVTVQK